ncbi:methylmalonyl Co-A mutase-associated GTPase MeaB [Stackebrandtia nassauensis]|uniref:LAO/AO transport system ATPase n=1 Tax=Stackebrandtia nassauensis (strain DSM 44728 / CIP 108903 / NRRL B-16338 / NBRC 102104 / LLR-40K-21) TaxID=446470 RepID=D3Q095_STANL|nr:methylmalonyl Co-A mutase-associated GTPase MeaB [Stackebrandtia nassauensis]ADD45624.1 LAO/AO transport system ATPase [Stackebrandtia nassauensis DSM 44728]
MSDIENLARRAADGDPRALGRLITVVENGGEGVRAVAATLAPLTGQSQVIGLTGSPGVGKSTTTTALVSTFRSAGKRVAVLAVDPSSPFTGGAILGDRVRMQEHALDEGVYIRSMSSRGHLGGLAAATPQAVRVLEACGFDVILIETVGVGQAEVEIAGLADTTLVLLAPGMGDGIQAVKAGILEVADIFVINKADRDGADATFRDIRSMMALVTREPHEWRQPIVKTIAHREEGIDEVVGAIEKHHQWLDEHGELRRRREARAKAEISAIVLGALARKYRVDETLAGRVAGGELDPYAAADEILDR